MKERNDGSTNRSAKSDPGSLPERLLALLSDLGYRGKIVEARHLEDLKDSIDKQLEVGVLSREVERKHMPDLDYDVLREHPEVRSIIVVAAPQPHLRLAFEYKGEELPVVIPPIYSSRDDKRAETLLKDALSAAGFNLLKRPLPLKLLAVHSGLARYGKNNIAYVEGMGSYCRLMAFYTDMPTANAGWFDLSYLDECEKCTACLKRCPTRAIVDDRFVIHAERCLTFFNEWGDDFPSDLDPTIHHCLIGCLYCQAHCPVNHRVAMEVENGPSFDSGETEALMAGASKSPLPTSVVDKLEGYGFLEGMPEVTRNLRLLLEVPGNIERGLSFIAGRPGRSENNDNR